MWLLLRFGAANTAAILILALLPIFSIAATLLKHESGQVRGDLNSANVEHPASKAEPLPGGWVE